MARFLPAACIAALAALAQAQTPRGFSDLVLGASQRPLVQRELDGASWQTMAAFGEVPYLWWPASDGASVPPHERELARRWLASHAAALGHAGFAPRYESEREWRGNQVWVYELQRDGARLEQARIELHYDGERFLGLVAHVPGPLLAIEDEGTLGAVPAPRAYVALPRDPGYVARLVPVHSVQRGNLVFTTAGPTTTVAPVQIPPPSPIVPNQFDEWVVPVGTFPDQIDVDSDGKVWFSQPNNNFLTRFDPVTAVFQRFPTTSGSGPDGMTVDPSGPIWTGLYFSGALGRLDPTTGTHTPFAAPYSGASMAIPMVATNGHVWVTDHVQVRLSEFNPVTTSWVQSSTIPTAGSWPVDPDEDPATQTIYVTCYSSNKLAIKPPGQPITETTTPFGGPAFGVWSAGKLYYSLWGASQLGSYDPQSGLHTTYNYPVAEPGGPIGATSDGRIVVGTRGVSGYVLVFQPATLTFKRYKVPTAFNSNMKDGLTVGPGNQVWFTETGANKIARLLLP